jgi:hypothetical protein
MALDSDDLEKIGALLRAALDEQAAPAALANKWRGGKMQLWPREPGMAAKELPLETFFHKVVMVRNQLRVLEQQINTHAKLDDHDRVHLQQYITRCYGSLTTFNVLFKDRDDQFSGGGRADPSDD